MFAARTSGGTSCPDVEGADALRPGRETGPAEPAGPGLRDVSPCSAGADARGNAGDGCNVGLADAKAIVESA